MNQILSHFILYSGDVDKFMYYLGAMQHISFDHANPSTLERIYRSLQTSFIQNLRVPSPIHINNLAKMTTIELVIWKLAQIVAVSGPRLISEQEILQRSYIDTLKVYRDTINRLR